MRLVCRAALLLVTVAAVARGQVRVVNMIPRHLSDETFQNAEPTLAVNPSNPAKMAASAYAPGGDLCSRGVEAPIFVTADSGKSWSLVCKIRVNSSTTLPPGDVSLRWASDGSALFAALLWPLNPITLQVFQTRDPMSPDTFVPIHKIPNVDQPDMAVMTIEGKTTLFVAADFFDADTGAKPFSLGTAIVLVSHPFRQPTPDSVLAPIEHRDISNAGRNYAVRVAAHPSGVVYALTYSPLPTNDKDPFVIEDVVVARDDSSGMSTPAFSALRDTPVIKARDKCKGRDGIAGFRVARCRTVPYPNDVANFGNQRRVSANLSIAVDKARASNVWIAWADSSDTNHYTLHVRRSVDAGRTWSSDLLTIPNATNPALTIADGGNAGFLFQQLQGKGVNQRWVTRLFTSTDGFKSKRSYTLATVPSNVPTPVLQPYIGDYIELRSVGSNFYGVFSAANTPDTLNFPNGVTFNRNADFNTNLLKNAHGGTSIGVSIDPFFFMVGPKEDPACPALRAKRDVRALRIGCR
jgi:hypothetical protein